MIRFTALNQDDEGPLEQAPVVDLGELELRKCQEQLNLALHHVHLRHNDTAKETLKKLLSHKLVEDQIQPIKKGTYLGQASLQHQIQFGVFKNYAEILEQDFQENKKKRTAEDAIHYYKKALYIDVTDRHSAYKLATLYGSGAIDNRALALKFSNLGLYGPSSEDVVMPNYSPIQWSCLEELARLHWDIGTFETSLELCDIGLKADPNNPMLNQLKSQLMQTWVTNFLSSDYYWTAPQTQKSSYGRIERRTRATAIYNEHPQIMHFPLKFCTWKGMAESLLEIHKELDTCKEHVKGRKRNFDQEIPPKDCPVIIDLMGDSHDSKDLEPIKRKRKESSITLENVDDKISSTVRTSKRVRHKLERNDFKKQRDAAASEFTKKIEAIFQHYDPEYLVLADDPEMEETEAILQYFEKIWIITTYNESAICTGVEEAAARYSCDTNKASNVRLSMFTPHANPPSVDSYFCDELATRKNLMDFGNSLNAKKFPISYLIRELIVRLLATPSNDRSSTLWCCRWPDDLKENIRDLTRIEGESLMEFLDESYRFSEPNSEQQASLTVAQRCDTIRGIKMAMETLLGILELLWDAKMPRLGSQRFEDDERRGGYYPMAEKTIFDKCLSSIENVKASLSEHISLGSSFSEHREWSECMKEYDEWIKKFNVRYYWAHAQIELCRGHLHAAMNCLKLCRESFKTYAAAVAEDNATIVMANFFYDAYINKETIDSKIRSLEIDDSLPKDNWSRSVRYFAEWINILKRAVSMGSNDDQIIQFWTIIHTINEQILDISNSIQNKESIECLHESDRKGFKNSVRLLYRLSLEILFPQDEQLANITYESTISTILNAFCVRVAGLLFKIFSINAPNASNDNLAEFLTTMHQQLGIREICASDHGAFLKLCLSVLPSLDPVEYQEQAFQCSYCLYGFTLGVDMDPPEDHGTQHVKLDQESAEVIFRMISSCITEKSLRTGQLKTGIKEALDEIAALVGPPISEDANVQMYRSWIENYLRSDINFEECIVHQYVDYRLAKKNKIPEIQKQLYYLRGKIYLYQYRTRSKANQTKAVIVLQNAVEQFMHDLYYNPYRFASWYALATCYASLAAENMTWSAAEIQSNVFAIAQYQKMAFLCFTLAAKLKESHIGPCESIPVADMINFWRDFGYHVYSMTTEPMARASFYPRIVPFPVPKGEEAYSFAAYCLGQALKYENMEDHDANSAGRDWRIPYMLGKCLQKLEKEPHVVLRLYKMAADRTPERSGISGQERIFDAEYKLTSTSAKYLYRNQIDPAIVKQYVKIDCSDTKNGPNDGNITNNDNDDNQDRNSNWPFDRKQAFDLIIAKLSEIRKSDKMKWHHRPVYRHAWLLYHVEQNPHEAKMVLQNLFQLKTSSKTIMNVWKPEFERAGRHFVYVHSYIKLLIELAKVTGDLDCISNLELKLRKAQNILLKDSELSNMLQAAYQSLVPSQPTIDPTSGKLITDYYPPQSIPPSYDQKPIPSQSSAFTQLPLPVQPSAFFQHSVTSQPNVPAQEISTMQSGIPQIILTTQNQQEISSQSIHTSFSQPPLHQTTTIINNNTSNI